MVGRKKDTFHLGWGDDNGQSTKTKANHPNKPRDNFNIGWGGNQQLEVPRNKFNPHTYEAPKMNVNPNRYTNQDQTANQQRMMYK